MLKKFFAIKHCLFGYTHSCLTLKDRLVMLKKELTPNPNSTLKFLLKFIGFILRYSSYFFSFSAVIYYNPIDFSIPNPFNSELFSNIHHVYLHFSNKIKNFGDNVLSSVFKRDVPTELVPEVVSEEDSLLTLGEEKQIISKERENLLKEQALLQEENLKISEEKLKISEEKN